VSQETAIKLSENSSALLTQGKDAFQTVIYRVYPAIATGQLATIEIRVSERPFDLPSYTKSQLKYSETYGADFKIGKTS
jgi:hypothetical protein